MTPQSLSVYRELVDPQLRRMRDQESKHTYPETDRFNLIICCQERVCPPGKHVTVQQRGIQEGGSEHKQPLCDVKSNYNFEVVLRSDLPLGR